MNKQNLIPYKPGQSGNPKGRPKGVKSMRTILREALEMLIETPNNEIVKKWTKEKNITIKEILVLREIVEALKGDEKAKTRVWEYVEGKPNQIVQHESGDSPVRIIIQK